MTGVRLNMNETPSDEGGELNQKGMANGTDGHTKLIDVQPVKTSLQQQPQGHQNSVVHWERFLPLRSLKVLLVENDDSTRHYHGGCLVGKVVDPYLRVIGIESLRVIDGSIFPISPGTNPQATVLMLGRYMGQQMLKQRMSST